MSGRLQRIVIVGAGAGGLAAAIDLARQGLEVTVLERATMPGGKLGGVDVPGATVDAGPTVLTMRWVFDRLFEAAGHSLEQWIALEPSRVLARHAWRSGGRLDLYADVERSAEAIAAFAGSREAGAYRAFCAESAAVYRTLATTFIEAQRPGPLALWQRIGAARLGEAMRIAPFRSLWAHLGTRFRDPRLRQLFARYATYCGSSPLAAPATLMLVAHVEQAGVWLPRGGMRALAAAMAGLATRLGATIRCGEPVSEIEIRRAHVRGVRLASGERVAADAIVWNGDVAALGLGLAGDAPRVAAPRIADDRRSLSAATWCQHAPTSGFPLERHNVFFAEDYPVEFTSIARDGRICASPTVYVCAQDRPGGLPGDSPARERLLVLVNAPPVRDASRERLDHADLARRVEALVGSCGLALDLGYPGTVVTTPHQWADRFPGSAGALYGPASIGAFAPFRRMGAASRVAGLYLAGGSVHPGPGVPMATLSGRLAAARLLADATR